jgi:hypothetical protein
MTEPNTQPPESPADEAPPTPFDHPLFLPVLLAAFSVWFGYDGYLSSDPDMQEHQAFNRFGLRVIGYLTAVVGYQGWCELKHRPASPWIVPVMLGVLALWSGFDGWISQDPLNLEYQPFIRHATVAWAVAAAGFAVSASQRAKGSAEPFFLLPLVVLGLSVSFGLTVDTEDDLLVAYLSACVGLFGVAVWLAMRKFRDRRAVA